MLSPQRPLDQPRASVQVKQKQRPEQVRIAAWRQYPAKQQKSANKSTNAAKENC
tara:strand:- start:513 stop:674 length:162 start_codon:yes stop_codon:yes gene_type:complete